MKDIKKITTMYEEYLRTSFEGMTKKETVDEFIKLAKATIDLSDDAVYTEVIRVLLEYEKRKAKKEPKVDKPQVNIDYTSLKRPKTFQDAFTVLKQYSKLGVSVDGLEDCLNAEQTLEHMKPYMFEQELPLIGLVNEMLTFTYPITDTDVFALCFHEGKIHWGYTHKTNSGMIRQDFDGELNEEDVLEVLGMISGAVLRMS